MKTITVNDIMDYRPCDDYSEERVRELIGGGKTPLEILDLGIPAENRIWVLTRPNMIPRDIQEAFARQCALRVVHLWDAPDVVRRYLETGDESLREAAWESAWESTWDSTWEAAWESIPIPAAAAAWATGRDMDAPWTAAWIAAGSAGAAELAGSNCVMAQEREEQVNILREVLNENVYCRRIE